MGYTDIVREHRQAVRRALEAFPTDLREHAAVLVELGRMDALDRPDALAVALELDADPTTLATAIAQLRGVVSVRPARIDGVEAAAYAEADLLCSDLGLDPTTERLDRIVDTLRRRPRDAAPKQPPPDPLPDVVAVARVLRSSNPNHVLLVGTRRGLEMPGGKTRTGETALEAARRETLEEASILATLHPAPLARFPLGHSNGEVIVFRGYGGYGGSDGEDPRPGPGEHSALWCSREDVRHLERLRLLSDVPSAPVLLSWAREGGA